MLLGVVPDSGAVQPGFDDAVEFQFDEVVNEASGGKLEDLVLVSPRPERVSVSWKRDRIEVRPRGGWRAGTVYQVQLLPGLADLRNNRIRDLHELIFSTGPAIPDTRLTGTVVNWPGARLAVRALIEAYANAGTDDSLAYVTQADSSGDFVLRALPPGRYLLMGTVDENNNRRRDRREAFDSVTVQLDTTGSHTLWAFVHDTVGPQLRTLVYVDSVTVRLEFSQHLAPGRPDSGSVRSVLLPDSTPVAIDTVLLPADYDSLRAREAQVRDSLAAQAADSVSADSVSADSAEAADSTVRADSARALRTPRARPGRPQVEDRRSQQPDTTRAAQILSRRPRLSDSWVVRLSAPLTPGARYVFITRSANVSNVVAESRAMLVVPDTTAAAGTRQ